MDDIVERIEPCPFCGGEASSAGHIRYRAPLGDTTWADGSALTEAFYVNCVKCGVTNGRPGLVGGYQTREEAISVWNARPAEATLRTRIAELEKEVERRTLDGIHTCHDQCQRPTCVQRRKAEQWQKVADEMAGALEASIKTNEALIKAALEVGGGHDLAAQIFPSGKAANKHPYDETAQSIRRGVNECRAANATGDAALTAYRNMKGQSDAQS